MVPTQLEDAAFFNMKVAWKEVTRDLIAIK
jgi:hypothetical protein